VLCVAAEISASRARASTNTQVRTTVDLAADAVGDPSAAAALALPAGTVARVRATPDTNSG